MHYTKEEVGMLSGWENVEIRNLASDWITQADRVSALEAENAKLRAIVAKLPKTADGVPVVPGMNLWELSTHQYPMHTEQFIEEVVSISQPRGFGGSPNAFCRCYSTREAAEAAKEE
jgi:hypothetical protein